ncbi:cation diffusion facilitator family transporter [Alteribacter natronophilus]|uniref:cation diffusion facilitator family transporter n=1 Tax=Alteribacter natronophilus TaxID=2583810 RepID=UPI00110E0B43|nr:cation transporter [Alteribacter natronophilus]TMW73003.1 cation transporter [Alteribacter natronophilus]
MFKSKEDRLLFISVAGALLFAVTGLVWGLSANSRMIFFDGVYSFISVILSLMTFLAARYVKKRDDRNFPYGKLMIEPFVILIKYAVITVLILLAGIFAVSDLAAGGRDVALGSALAYSVLSTVACFGYVFYIRFKNREAITNFVRAEMNQWLMDGYLSLGVFAGFIGAVLLQGTGLDALVPFVDPILVLIVSLLLLKVPLVYMYRSFREIIGMSDTDETAGRVKAVVQKMERQYKMKESFTRISRAGSGIYIDIDFVITASCSAASVREQDKLREILSAELKEITGDPWLTVTFTADRKWAL